MSSNIKGVANEFTGIKDLLQVMARLRDPQGGCHGI